MTDTTAVAVLQRIPELAALIWLTWKFLNISRENQASEDKRTERLAVILEKNTEAFGRCAAHLDRSIQIIEKLLSQQWVQDSLKRSQL